MRIDCCGNLYTGLLLCNIANLRYVQTKIEGIIKEKPMAEKKKVLYIVEAMGGGVFTYIVDTKLLSRNLLQWAADRSFGLAALGVGSFRFFS